MIHSVKVRLISDLIYGIRLREPSREGAEDRSGYRKTCRGEPSAEKFSELFVTHLPLQRSSIGGKFGAQEGSVVRLGGRAVVLWFGQPRNRDRNFREIMGVIFGELVLFQYQVDEDHRAE